MRRLGVRPSAAAANRTEQRPQPAAAGPHGAWPRARQDAAASPAAAALGFHAGSRPVQHRGRRAEAAGKG